MCIYILLWGIYVYIFPIRKVRIIDKSRALQLAVIAPKVKFNKNDQIIKCRAWLGWAGMVGLIAKRFVYENILHIIYHYGHDDRTEFPLN